MTRSDADEFRRFLLALGGVIGSLLIAAGIFWSTPRLSFPEPPAPARAARSHLGAAFQFEEARSVLDQPRPVAPIGSPSRAMQSSGRAVKPVAPLVEPTAPATASADIRGVVDPALPATAHPALSFTAPEAASTLLRHESNAARRRGPVTGAFASAGSHVGGGFRTVGRAIRRVF